MTEEPKITCPECGTHIKLTESLAAPIIASARAKDNEKLRLREAAFKEREAKFHAEANELAAARLDFDAQIAEKLAHERKSIQEVEATKARHAARAELIEKSREVVELQDILKERETKLAQAQKAELDFRKKERALADAQRELELDVEKRVQSAITEAQNKARAEIQTKLGLEVSEKNEQIASLKRTIDELNRKAEQGSQQTQGEALELHLEVQLGQKYPNDVFEPVQKGASGADLLQRVVSSSGAICGTIIWETKRTKNWNNEWLSKLRNDQRAAKADIAVIVSTVLPKGVTSFDFIDGIWIVGVPYVGAVSSVLRQGLVDVQAVKIIQQGQQTKTEMVYAYLTGPHFKQRVEAIVESFTAMQTDLNKERVVMQKNWAKREKQIQAVIDSTVGMYGDLQGIAGQAIGEIKGLEFESETQFLDGDGS